MSHFSGPWLSSFINGRESGGHNKQKEDWKGAERSGNKANYSKALVSDHGTHTNKSLEIVTNLVVPLPAKANKQEAWGSKAYGSVCFCFQNPLRMFMAFLGQDCKVELEQTQVLHQNYAVPFVLSVKGSISMPPELRAQSWPKTGKPQLRFFLTLEFKCHRIGKSFRNQDKGSFGSKQIQKKMEVLDSVTIAPLK